MINDINKCSNWYLVLLGTKTPQKYDMR